MTGSRKQKLVDRAVDLVARMMNAIGLNGTRLLWKWGQRRQQLAEAGLKREILWRSAQGRHKMCRDCRALVPRSARVCPDCGAGLDAVRAPGVGRTLSNLFPGAKTASALLLLVNGFWFLLTLLASLRATGSDGAAGLGLLGSFNPQLLVDFGSGASWLTFGGEWWRLITPIFLHAGIIHFFFNSYVLLQLGPLAETEFGIERFWVAYLCSGIAGSTLSQALRPVNTIGASGAIFGLMGLLLVHGWLAGGARGQGLRQMILRYLMYTAFLSLLVRNIDHLNHLGGLACGAALGALVPAGPLRNRWAAAAWQWAAIGGVLLVLYAFFRVAGKLG